MTNFLHIKFRPRRRDYPKPAMAGRSHSKCSIPRQHCFFSPSFRNSLTGGVDHVFFQFVALGTASGVNTSADLIVIMRQAR